MNEPQLKCVKAADTRWLSHDRAVNTLRQTYGSVVVSLEREAQERHDVTAAGLATQLKGFDFIATVLALSDVLPRLSTLSRVFQVKLQNM